jgi:O-antigen/teichoic acid export membrane protein
MPARVTDALARHRIGQRQERMAADPEWEHSGVLSTTPSGKMISSSTSESASSGHHVGELRILARGGLMSLIGSVTNALLGFGFVVVIGRTLSVRQAGGLFEAIAIFTILNFTAVLGADAGLLKLMPTIRVPADLRVLVAVSIIPAFFVGVALSAVMFFNAASLARLLIHQGPVIAATKELRIVALFLPFATTTTIALAGVRAWSITQSVAVQSLLVPIGRLILIGAFISLGITPLLGALAFAAPFVIGAMAAGAFLLYHLEKPIFVGEPPAERAGTRSSRKHIFGEFWRFSAPRGIGAFFSVLLLLLDVVLLGALGSSAEVASYNVASRYIMIGGLGLSAMAFAISPQLSRLWAAGMTRAVRTVYRESTWWIMGISWPVLILMASFAPLLMLLVNRHYTTGVVALEVLAVATLVNTGTGNNFAAILMAGKNSTVLLIEASELTLNVILNVVLIPRLGATGAAIAWSVSILYGAVFASIVLFRIEGIHPFGRGYWAVTASTLFSYGISGLVARLVFGATWASAVVVGVLGSALYCGWLTLFNRKEWINFRELLALITPSASDATSR